MSYHPMDIRDRIKSTRAAIKEGDWQRAERNLVIADDQARELETAVSKSITRMESATVWLEDIERECDTNDSINHYIRQAKKAVADTCDDLLRAR